MGLPVDKRLKLDTPLGLNLTSTEPRPIKVTRTAAELKPLVVSEK
jgi:hypothetical protein